MTARADRPLTDRDFRALATFRHGLRRFMHFSEGAARAAGLTPAQHQLLLAVRGHAGPNAPSLSDVADQLMLRRHSASELVERAVANGLISRTVDPSDHRRIQLALTPAGTRHLDALSRQHRDELRRYRTELVALLDELE
jgi:DNA-binding MarR family transcriptional regulator